MSISCPFNANATDWKCFELIWELLLSILIYMMIFDFLESFCRCFLEFCVFFTYFVIFLIACLIKMLFGVRYLPELKKNIQYSEKLEAESWSVTVKYVHGELLEFPGILIFLPIISLILHFSLKTSRALKRFAKLDGLPQGRQIEHHRVSSMKWCKPDKRFKKVSNVIWI